MPAAPDFLSYGVEAASRGRGRMLAKQALAPGTPTPDPKSAKERPGDFEDNSRRAKLGMQPDMTYSSWLWPASFYWFPATGSRIRMSDIIHLETRQQLIAAGRPELFVNGQLRSDINIAGADWIKRYCDPVRTTVHGRQVLAVAVSVSPRGKVAFAPAAARTKLRLGDVILFKGRSYISPGNRIDHSAIATGKGTEVSHKWFNRQIQAEMVAPKKKWLEAAETDSYDPESDYPVTRDRIEDLAVRFTDSRNTTYYFDRFRIYRIKDVRLKDRASLESLLSASWQ